MALMHTLQAKGIHPMFWPPMDANGNPAVRWQGRSRSCSDSFADYKRRAPRETFVAKHVAKSKRNSA